LGPRGEKEVEVDVVHTLRNGRPRGCSDRGDHAGVVVGTPDPFLRRTTVVGRAIFAEGDRPHRALRARKARARMPGDAKGAQRERAGDETAHHGWVGAHLAPEGDALDVGEWEHGALVVRTEPEVGRFRRRLCELVADLLQYRGRALGCEEAGGDHLVWRRTVC